MTAYNRLNGTFCGEHPWLITEVLRGEWGFDGVVMSDWFGTHSAVESLRAGLDLEMPGPPRERGVHLREAIDAGVARERELDPAVARLLALGEWTGAATTGTAETTADDPATRDVIRRAAIRSMVLLKDEDAALPLAPTVRRIALIGPYARYGRPQGGGSARVRPDHGRGPFDALEARGFDVAFEPGGSIAKYLPTVRGEFTVTFEDPSGATADVVANRLSWYWDRPPHDGIAFTQFAARIAGTFVPDETGEWELSVRAVGPVSVSLDGEVVVSIDEAQRGGAFFGMGSPESRGTVALEAGRAYELAVDYPPGAADERVRGLIVGARLVPASDHIELAVATATGADVAIVIVGTDDDWETEGEDRTALALPRDQDDLVAAVAAANPNTVVVLNTGSPVTMPWLDAVPRRAAAVVPRPGDRRRARRRADRRRRAGWPAADHLSGPARGHAGVHDPPRARRPGRLQRAAVHRAPLVRPRGHRAAVPVRVRARVHDVRTADGGRRRRRRGRRDRRRDAAQHRAPATAARSCRSTSSRRSATRSARCGTSPASPAPTWPPVRKDR